MRLENLVKKFIIASLAATLIYNTPVRAEDNIEPYLKQKIIQLEKENKKIEALKTQYFLERITELKKEYKKKYLNEVKQNKDFSWDTTEKILAASYLTLNARDTYKSLTTISPNKVKESNPLISSWAGEYPTKTELLLSKTILTAGELYLFSKLPELLNNYIDCHKSRKCILLLYNLAYTGILIHNIHNEKIAGDIIFKF